MLSRQNPNTSSKSINPLPNAALPPLCAGKNPAAGGPLAATTALTKKQQAEVDAAISAAAQSLIEGKRFAFSVTESATSKTTHYIPTAPKAANDSVTYTFRARSQGGYPEITVKIMKATNPDGSLKFHISKKNDESSPDEFKVTADIKITAESTPPAPRSRIA